MKQFVVGEIQNSTEYPKNLVVVPESWVFNAVDEQQQPVTAIKYIDPPFEESGQSLVQELVKENCLPPDDWKNYVFNIISPFASLKTAETYINDQLSKPPKKNTKSKNRTNSKNPIAQKQVVSNVVIPNNTFYEVPSSYFVEQGISGPEFNLPSPSSSVPINLVTFSPEITNTASISTSSTQDVFVPTQEEVSNQSGSSNVQTNNLQRSSFQNSDLSSESNLVDIIEKRFKNFDDKIQKIEINMNSQFEGLDKKVDSLYKSLQLFKKEFDKKNEEFVSKVDCVQITINSCLKDKLTDFLSFEDFIKKYQLQIPINNINDFNNFELSISSNDLMLSDLKKLLESNLISAIEPIDKAKEAKNNVKLLIKKCLTHEVLEHFNAQKVEGTSNQTVRTNLENLDLNIKKSF